MRTNWQTKTLGDVCEVEYGTRVVRKKDGGSIFPVFGGGGATFFMDTFNREDCLIISRFGVSEECARFVNGKFFLNDSGLSVAPKNSKELSQNFLDLEIRYLNNHIYSLCRGTAQKNLDVPAFREMEISFPESLPEQRRIVAILDDVFERVAKAKANAEKNLANAKGVFESYLQKVFANPIGDWKEKSIADVCDEIFAGGDAPNDNFSKEKTEKYAIPIYANAVKDRGLYGYTNFARVTKPSITIAARGSGTGHTELRNEAYLPIVRLIVLIPNTELVTLDFLKYKIDTIDILRSGSAIPQLTVPMIKEYGIPIPSLKEQRTIVANLDALFSETKQLEAIYRQKLSSLEEMKKSVLRSAFRGEL